jgi:hypothetical protein
MKRLLPLFLMLSFNTVLFSQTAEQRETRLLESLGTLSSAFIYNAYVVIGSVSDATVDGVYTDSLATAVLQEQQGMLDVVIESLNMLVKEKALKDVNDVKYVNTLNPILKGLKAQAQSYMDFLKTKNTVHTTEFARLRKSNWKSICVILNIPYQEN